MIKLFDFDGVLGSAFEEALFQLPISLADQTFIEKASHHFGIENFCESQVSLRYMCMQALMASLNKPIEVGPMIEEATGNFMILTARSDYFAIQRMFQFLNQYQLKPMRVFTLGSTPKSDVVRKLLEQYPEPHYEFSYWDDLEKNIDAVACLKSPRITIHKVDNDMEAMYHSAMRYYQDVLLRYFD